MSDARKPPYDLDAERNVLSSILIDRDALIKAAEVLDDIDFYNPAHKIIYGGCKELFEKSSAVDVVTLKSYLSKNKLLRDAGGDEYLYDLVSILPLTTNVEYYSQIIKEASLRRKLISMSADLVGMGMDEGKNLEEIIDEVEKKIFAVSQKSKNKTAHHISEFIDLEKKFNEAQDPNSNIRGLSSGFRTLDTIIGGMNPGDLIIIAARPSVGKTAFMLEMARHVSLNLKKKTFIFSLEMSGQQCADRLLSLQSRVNLFDIRMGNFHDVNLFKSITDAAGMLYESSITIDDIPGQYVNDIRTKCRKRALEEGIDIIFLDYLQLLRAHVKGDNRAQEVTEISQTLKNIARELKVPVIVAAQLNRAVESRTDRRPQLSDIRESGSIEQDADMVIFLHRESRYKIDDESIKDKAEVIVAKNRNGSTGIIEMKFIGEQARYEDLEVAG